MGRPRGPGATLPAAPAYTFGSRSSPPSSRDIVPGPGTYRPLLSSSDFLSSRGTGFGTSGRLATCGNKNPGPSEYNPRERVTRSASPSYTFKGVAAKNHLVKNPAPGHYNPDRAARVTSTHTTAPSVSISHRLPPPKSHSRQPAPGEYETYSPYLERGKGLPVTFKFRHDQTTNRASVAPGPGEYPARSCLNASAKTIATRLTPSSYRQQQQIPGPAEYEVFDSTIGVAGELHM